MREAPGCPATSSAPPALDASSTAPPCFVLFDRHLQKTGGSSLSVLMQRLEEHGECLYWGFMISASSFKNVANALANLNRTSPVLPKLCVDAHVGVTLGNLDSKLRWLGELEGLLQSRGVGCRVLRTTRFRDPLSHYLSFYLWLVRPAGSARKCIIRDDHFLRWVNATPNLQASLLLNPRSVDIALMANLSTRNSNTNTHRNSGSWGSTFVPSTSASKERLRTLLTRFDLVSPLERFDEFILMIAHALGLRNVQYSKVDPTCIRGRAARYRLEEEASCAAFSNLAHGCKAWKKACAPEMRGACEEAVRRAAPLDYWLHEQSRRLHEAAVVKAGGRAWIEERVRHFRDKTVGVFVGGPPRRPKCGFVRVINRSDWRHPSFPDHPCTPTVQEIGEAAWRDRQFLGRAHIAPIQR